MPLRVRSFPNEHQVQLIQGQERNGHGRQPDQANQDPVDVHNAVRAGVESVLLKLWACEHGKWIHWGGGGLLLECHRRQWRWCSKSSWSSSRSPLLQKKTERTLSDRQMKLFWYQGKFDWYVISYGERAEKSTSRVNCIMIKTEIGVDADVASLYLSRVAMKCACTVLEHHIFGRICRGKYAKFYSLYDKPIWLAWLGE